MELCDTPVSELVALLRKRSVSAVEVLESSLARIEAVDGRSGSLNAGALSADDRAKVHGSVVGREELDRLCAHLLASPVAAVAALPTMVPGRADVICAGALICRRVAARLSGELTVSEADILDGLVHGLAGDTQL